MTPVSHNESANRYIRFTVSNTPEMQVYISVDDTSNHILHNLFASAYTEKWYFDNTACFHACCTDDSMALILLCQLYMLHVLTQ